MGEEFIMNRRTLLAGTAFAALAPIISVADTQLSPAAAQTLPKQKPTVLITGTSSGIGKAAAIAFAKAGWFTLATMRDVSGRNLGTALELTEIAKAEALALRVIEIDVTNAASVGAGVAEAETLANGRFDLLVNNAGIYVPLPAELMTPEALQISLDTNVLGYQRMARAIAPYMRARGDGLVLNISSGAGRVVFPLLGGYCATKHAVEALSDSWRYELAPFGVDVCVLQPDDTRTQLFDNARRYVQDMLAKLPAADERRRSDYQRHLSLLKTALEVEDDAAEPAVVAAAILKLAQTPKGQRPARTRLGGQLPVAINDAVAQAQQKILKNSPFADWMTVKL
ncbi:MAG: SDR family NAD(P)-dependent oxidoreductase [Chitinophagales bacterium]|nr:SDR family NAD(P)-dependent oxidoreductase [Hyphomicrobiales bacterium]